MRFSLLLSIQFGLVLQGSSFLLEAPLFRQGRSESFPVGNVEANTSKYFHSGASQAALIGYYQPTILFRDALNLFSTQLYAQQDEDEENPSQRKRLWRRIRRLYDTSKSKVKRIFRRKKPDAAVTCAEPKAEPITEEVDIPLEDVTETISEAEEVTGHETTEKETDAAAEAVAEVLSGKPPRAPKGVRARTETSSGVDLSGQWNIVVTDEFKDEYEKYLTLLGQPVLVRSVALSIVGLTTEETEQSENGRILAIRGRNVRGTWDRTLTTGDIVDIVTADGEDVKAEAWWEDGRIHRSWLRGVSKYGGGSFESKRYLESDGKILVCESIFHPDDDRREKATVTWRFLREGATL